MKSGEKKKRSCGELILLVILGVVGTIAVLAGLGDQFGDVGDEGNSNNVVVIASITPEPIASVSVTSAPVVASVTPDISDVAYRTVDGMADIVSAEYFDLADVVAVTFSITGNNADNAIFGIGRMVCALRDEARIESGYNFIGEGAFVDAFGNPVTLNSIQIRLSYETIEQINCEFDAVSVNWEAIADSYFVDDRLR